MKKKVSYTILILTLSLVFLNSSNITKVSSSLYPNEIVGISLYPNPIEFGKIMSVQIQFDCETNATAVKLFIYKITDTMICLCDYVYVQMYEIENNIRCPGALKFEGNYSVDFPIGMQIGYRIQIFYDNGTIVYVPKVANFLDIATIEPLNNEIMFDAGKVQDGTSQTDLTVLSIITSTLIISTILVKRRNKIVN